MRLSLSRKRLAVLGATCLLLIVVFVVVSWRREEATVEKPAAKSAEKPKPPFTVGLLQTLPYGEGQIGDGLKVLHWTSAELELTANHADFRGELVVTVKFDDPNDLTPQVSTAHDVTSRRSIVLPKGQKRRVETTLFSSFGVHETSPLRAEVELRTPGGVEVFHSSISLALMQGWQHHFVVLAQTPTDYQFLNSLDSVYAPQIDLYPPNLPQYHVALLPPGPVSLPSNLLRWTSTAYLLWDNRRPEDLTLEQQQALIDWLHWGGQVIVNGPGSLDSLRESFLAPFLPATSGGSWQIEQADLDDWQGIGAKKFFAHPRLSTPLSGVHLVPSPAAEVLAASHDEPLIVERRVGRGRTVVTAFRLAEESLINWPHYDEVFNALLLRRPARQFFSGGIEHVSVRWSDGRADRSFYSTLRLLTNDGATGDLNYSRGLGSFSGPISSGPAQWNNFSPIANAAQASLREAAGVVVPDRNFVAWLVLTYVVVLVPINGLLFWLLGRVELAWLAAPAITLAFAVVVVRMAEVDVGFVRARTEVDIIELHAGYPRGHLTRYTALYSPLGTSYRISNSEPSALELPMVLADPSGVGRFMLSDRSIVIRENRAAGADEAAFSIDDFEVASNTTTLLHGEQMLDLGGTIEAVSLGGQRYRIENRSSLSFDFAAIVFGEQAAWLEKLAAGETREATLSPSDPESWLAKLPTISSDPAVVTLARANIQAVMSPPHGLRLIGWINDVQPGLDIDPMPSQVRGGTMVVVNLALPPLPQVEPDQNTRAEVQRGLDPNAVFDEPRNKP